MSKFADELIASMKQAAAHAGGQRMRGLRVTTVEVPDVKATTRASNLAEFLAASPLRASRMKIGRMAGRLRKLDL